MNKRLLRLIQEGNEIKFYQSKEWRKKRKEILIRDNKECQHCKEKGKVTVDNLEVHHKKHLKDYPLLALDDKNLITLCTSCHNKEHPEKISKMNRYNNEFTNKERW